MTDQRKPLVLLMLDGFGSSADNQYNAVANSDAPTLGQLLTNNPKTLMHTS